MRGGDSPASEVSEAGDKPSDADADAKTEPEAEAKEKDESAAAAKDKAAAESPFKSLDLQLVEWNQKLVSENKNLHQVKTFFRVRQ
jgi:hypothetical protein